MTAILLIGTVASTTMGETGSMDSRPAPQLVDGPGMIPSRAQPPLLTPVPIGSGFQTPWMQDTRYNQPIHEPVSPIAVVALVIVYATFLALIVWAILYESSRMRNQRRRDNEVETEDMVDQQTDRVSQIDAWFRRNHTEARK